MPAIAVWWDPPADGPTNMAADECLAEEADRCGGLFLRVYGWSATTVSLGAFQRSAEARDLADLQRFPLVRRPSGGGAIIHGTDMTYAAAVPRRHPWGSSASLLYDALHGAMAEVLQDCGVPAGRYTDAGSVPAVNAETPFLCFDRRSPGDLVVAVAPAREAKVMGSAQRRLAGVVLQHGSLLVHGNQDLCDGVRHAGVAELVPGAVLPSLSALARRWIDRLAATLGATLHEESHLSASRVDRVTTLAARYRDGRWTDRR